MKSRLISLLLCFAFSGSGIANATLAHGIQEDEPLPPVQALITYFTQEVSPDGITQQHSYKERWIRDGNTLWSERLIPLPVARAFHQVHDNAKTPHKHFMYQMAARWLTHKPDGNLDLNYVDHYHKNQVYYPPNEYGQSGFVPEWEKLTRLFAAENLALMSLEPANIDTEEQLPEQGKDARWYRLEQHNQILRVLWSEKLQLALAVDRRTLDGYKQYRMNVTLKPDLPTPRPWEKLADYEQKEISDFFD
ncbi:MAG: hypothetical protein ACRCRW_07215 [Aeromonadaceae bacterium]